MFISQAKIDEFFRASSSERRRRKIIRRGREKERKRRDGAEVRKEDLNHGRKGRKKVLQGFLERIVSKLQSSIV